MSGAGAVGSAGTAGAGQGGEGGSDAAGAAGDVGMAGVAGSATPTVAPLPLGSRELDGVVNLVDAAAAAELEEYMMALDVENYWEGSLTANLNLFLKHYVEEYDFVYFFTDHPIEASNAIGRHEAVTRRASPGTGFEYDELRDGYTTNGKTKGIIGVQYRPDRYGPLGHEMAHQWANYLDRSFGFGIGLNDDVGQHWGYVGLHGVLGGFDPATLRCESPAGMAPPGCTAEASGRTRYSLEAFGPNDNGVAVPFAPLELYLMGLLPLSEVPPEIPMLIEAEPLYDTYDETTNRFVVEASALESMPLADIVALHGKAELLPAGQRAFKAAFVVVSAEPADDAVLREIAEYAAFHGNRAQKPTILSFETLTGGRATLDTRLGARRKISEPAPAVRKSKACDMLEQDDCGSDRACHYYGRPISVCGLVGTGTEGEPCQRSTACARGFECVGSASVEGTGACQPFCEPTGTGPDSCQTVCTGNWINLADVDDVVHAGVCRTP
jgi:hypothetical protein